MKTLFNLSVMLLTLTGFLFVIWYAYPKDAQSASILGDALPDASGITNTDIVNHFCKGDVSCEIKILSQLNDEGIK